MPRPRCFDGRAGQAESEEQSMTRYIIRPAGGDGARLRGDWRSLAQALPAHRPTTSMK